ncbi:hypothetical protein CALVIDRAFT_556315 [Calocera viscosa TUFC12733]|uniref:F-box domain-containing protein n=1 Tax=Calocera viscosa (strain TUFC12733) TaxID=1330018 RepID=A0A167KDI7_CALVF|nr:hypothetical protein CALVIDRAFT_556315 [Calocera viscosa TUFC12733]
MAWAQRNRQCRTERVERELSDSPAPRISLNTLPVELVQYILRLATDVPVAFNTSCFWVLDEDRERTRRLIIDSLQTKTSLSLVCKPFHLLVDEYLYEALVLTRPPTCDAIRRLPSLLRARDRGGPPARGDRVRRLEMHFQVSERDEWMPAWDTLWGLLPACPNLEALYFHPRRASFYHWSSSEDLHRVWCVDGSSSLPAWTVCSEEFVRNVARTCGKTLRRLDMPRYVKFSRSYLQPMLASMCSLEVIHIAKLDESLTPIACSSKKWIGILPAGEQLQNLHTLLLESMPLQIDAGQMPKLKHITIWNRYIRGVEDHVRDLLRIHALSIVSIYYHQENERIVVLPDILDMLPNLEHLRLRDCWRSSWDKVLPTRPHMKIRAITVFLFNGMSTHEHSLIVDVKKLLHRVQQGRIPALKKIQVAGRTCEQFLRPNRLGARLLRMGITWELRPDLISYYD